MTDCHSLVDIKVTANPVLYMPAEMPAPPDVAALSEKCHVKIVTPPAAYRKTGRSSALSNFLRPACSIFPIPTSCPADASTRCTAGTATSSFSDSKPIIAKPLAKGMVDNFLFEIEHYGAVLNANRTYYLTRSQPPFLTSMIRAVYENPASFPATPAGRTAARAWLEHAYKLAEKDYSTWTRPEHKAGTTGLARYFDYGTGPVPEMADDSTYYTDVIRWLVAHPASSGSGENGQSFLVKGTDQPDAAEAARLKQTSCDVKASVVCMRAWADGYRLTKTSTSATAPCVNRDSIRAFASAHSAVQRTTTRRCA